MPPTPDQSQSFLVLSLPCQFVQLREQVAASLRLSFRENHGGDGAERGEGSERGETEGGRREGGRAGTEGQRREWVEEGGRWQRLMEEKRKEAVDEMI